MFGLRRNTLRNQAGFLVIALLISGILTVPCAEAYTLCDDCPEHEPVLCLDACLTAEATTIDSTPDIVSGTTHTTLLAYNQSSSNLEFKADQLPVLDKQPPDPRASPPLHLQFCIFLK